MDESEIVLLKPKPTPPVEAQIQNAEKGQIVNVEIKPPISFEVMLDGDQKQAKRPPPNNEQTKPSNDIEQKSSSEDDQDEYEDDFESYESDFETDISSQNEIATSDTKSTISTGESDDNDDNVVSTASKHPFETGASIDNSELDSGSFEMKVLSAQKRKMIEKSRIGEQIEMQNDSGIENNSNTFGGGGGGGINALNPSHQMNSLEFNNKTADNISDIEIEGGSSLDTCSTVQKQPKSRLTQRGEELLRKITLDVMNYVLFDFKPIPYELFMKIYGSSNMTQIAVQTHNDRIDQEFQCDAVPVKTVWTQYPILFYTEHLDQVDLIDYKNGFGCVAANDSAKSRNAVNKTFDDSLNFIQNMSTKTNGIDTDISVLNINYERLNMFLLECELTLSHLIDGHSTRKQKQLQKTELLISKGFYALNASRVGVTKQIFSSICLPGFVFTLHREIESNLDIIAIWNLANVKSPICLLSVWSKVVCLEIHSGIKNVVFAGLYDG